jgi:hypothetical protein
MCGVHIRGQVSRGTLGTAGRNEWQDHGDKYHH